MCTYIYICIYVLAYFDLTSIISLVTKKAVIFLRPQMYGNMFCNMLTYCSNRSMTALITMIDDIICRKVIFRISHEKLS